MGEELFWAIRGGGAASFGIVLAWKIRLVQVPSSVTISIVNRNLEQNETLKLVNRWQYVADKFNEDLLIFVRFVTVNATNQEENSKTTIQVTFVSWFLGGVDGLLSLMEKSFPEFGFVRSVHQVKLDYVKKPIPKEVLETMLKRLYEEEVIGKEEGKGDIKAVESYLNWIRSVYNYMTPYVSKNPRGAYLNYRDLDLGTNNNKGPTSYAQASIWGKKYFQGNFKRLVYVKTKVDPTNFFKNEQRVPPLPLLGVNKNNNYA
ncbi:Berberine/berberine-like [Trema orientale]|uniref:Berberine/berberine-like n=1 Tax=Trema orientale TaxID=63057 RepID=A0A2P5FTJ8_TREOI|nr:Berberine/berberine-like [Trema orientale]